MAAGYSYQPLQDAGSQLRLLWLGRGSHADDQVDVSVRVVNIAEAPKYFAISYTWGDPESERQVRVDGEPMTVRQNCFYALWQAQQRRPCSYVWIDSICINQQDLAEKSCQVQMMGRIYALSTGVLSSLGPHGNDSEYLFAKLHDMMAWKARSEQSPPPPSKWIDEQDEQTEVRLANAMSHLSIKPYFERLWVIQELLLGPTVDILCGPDEVSLEAVDVFDEFTKGKAYIKGGAYAWRIGPVIPFTQLLMRMRAWPDRLRGDDSTWKLKNLLHSCANFGCADARDRVFAMTALVQLPDGALPIVTNYSASDFQMALDTVRHFTSDDRDETSIFYVKRLVRTLSIDLDSRGVLSWIRDSPQSSDQSAAAVMSNPDPRGFLRDKCADSCRLSLGDDGRLTASLSICSYERDRFVNDFPTSFSRDHHPAFQEVTDGNNCVAYVAASARPGDYLVQVLGNGNVNLVVRQYEDRYYEIVGQAIVLTNTDFAAHEPPGKRFRLWTDPEDAVLLSVERPVSTHAAGCLEFHEVAERYATRVTRSPLSSFAVLADD
ncbi:heterokaryon incompatibility protein-domain-containing protein [Astrocystis sublimbata]|nr:heterokaryon incompatibility protein-domain-containing protein [Astrocystis sublimbata]